MKKSILIVFACAILCTALPAQNVRIDDTVFSRNGNPAPGAHIAVCRQPANTSTTPCTPPASLCTSLIDATCNQSNVLTADGLGNYHFYIVAGSTPYTLQFYGSGLTPYSIPDKTYGVGSGGLGTGVNATVTGIVYTFQGSDNGKLVLAQNTAPMTFTLPDPSTLSSTFVVSVQNIGTALLTVVAPTTTIDGISGSVGTVIIPGQGMMFFANSAADSYNTLRGIGFIGSYSGNTTFVGNHTQTGAMSISSTLGVTGTTTLAGDLNVGGAINQTGTGAWQFSGKEQSALTVTVPGGSDFSTFVGSDNTFHCQLSVALGSGNCDPGNMVALPSQYTNATTNFTNVAAGGTTLQFAIGANQSFTIQCLLIWQTNTTNVGMQYQFTGPSSPTSVVSMSIIQTGLGMTPANAASFSSVLGGGSTFTSNTNYFLTLSLAVVNGANAGTIALQGKMTGSATGTVQTGSECTRIP